MIFKNKKGFALITVFLISTILAGVIGFTFISVNRNINLKSMLHLSKTSLTTADAGLEEIMREIQSEHFNNIGHYLLNLYEDGLDTTPALYTYYPDFFKDPRNGNYITTRAKYFLDFDYYILDNEGNPVPQKIVNWEDSDSDGLADEGEYIAKQVTEPNEVTIHSDIITYLENLSWEDSNTIIYSICNDIQSAYNQWMTYLWGLNWSEGFKTTDTGENLGKMEEMISKIGGNDLVPECSGIDINDVVKPYDVDHPATNETYEGVIVQSAGKIDSSITSPQRGLIIITAIGYSFSSPIPKDDYNNIVKPKLSLVCPRPSDPEY
ncbi:hypothetical protein GX420_06675, partial [bacterium]|nr:hypothetical protein [bacterium]